jgi:hypothetical protein
MDSRGAGYGLERGERVPEVLPFLLGFRRPLFEQFAVP